MGRKKVNKVYNVFEYIEDTKKSKCRLCGFQMAIKPNDGLPQKICSTCKNPSIAHDLRDRSRISELKLNSKYKYCKTEYSTKEDLEMEDQILDFDPDLHIKDLTSSCYIAEGFEVEIEIDRITKNQDCVKSQNGISKNAEKKKSKAASVKEKREIYMSLVEGDFNPNGPVTCNVCMVTVSKWTCFVSHAKKHLGFKVICEFCGKSFMSMNQLKRHCRSFHGLERELKCKHCSYLALDKAQLMLHERRSHTGDRPYICDTCSSSYYSRKCLVQHLESHIAHATVQCESCPLRLKSRRHLAKHRYRAHGRKRKRKRERERARQIQPDPETRQ